MVGIEPNHLPPSRVEKGRHFTLALSLRERGLVDTFAYP